MKTTLLVLLILSGMVMAEDTSDTIAMKIINSLNSFIRGFLTRIQSNINDPNGCYHYINKAIQSVMQIVEAYQESDEPEWTWLTAYFAAFGKEALHSYRYCYFQNYLFDFYDLVEHPADMIGRAIVNFKDIINLVQVFPDIIQGDWESIGMGCGDIFHMIADDDIDEPHFLF